VGKIAGSQTGIKFANMRFYQPLVDDRCNCQTGDISLYRASRAHDPATT
jgi:hypothetical protein